jgi:hypothetical protein
MTVVTDYIQTYDPVTEQFTDVRDPGSIYFTRNMTAQWTNKLKSAGKLSLATSSKAASNKNVRVGGGGSGSIGIMGFSEHVIGGPIHTEEQNSKLVYVYAIASLFLIASVLVCTSARCHRGKSHPHSSYFGMTSSNAVSSPPYPGIVRARSHSDDSHDEDDHRRHSSSNSKAAVVSHNSKKIEGENAVLFDRAEKLV